MVGPGPRFNPVGCFLAILFLLASLNILPACANNFGPSLDAALLARREHLERFGERATTRKQASSGSSGDTILYNGGPIMAGGINLYLIFYGNWGLPGAPTCSIRSVVGLLQSLSDPILAKAPGPTAPKWWKTVTKYHDGQGQHVSPQVRVVKAVFDRYSRGPLITDDFTAFSPKDSDAWKIIAAKIRKKTLPADPKGMYFVLTSEDVKVGDFCNGYCAYHSNVTLGATGMRIKYAVVGNAETQCPEGCLHNSGQVGPKGQLPPTPNACWGPDNMASSILHELAEAATDPEGDGWTTALGEENGDLCTLGVEGPLGTLWNPGPKRLWQYNLVAKDGLKYYVQSMYDPVKQACVQTS